MDPADRREDAVGAPLVVEAKWAAVLALLGVPAAVAGALVGMAIAAGLNSFWMRDIARWLLLDCSTSVQVVLGTWLFFWLPPVTMVLASGMIGKNFPGWLGEWLARIRGYTLLAGIGWIFFFGCSLWTPGAATHLWHSPWIKWPAILTWEGPRWAAFWAARAARPRRPQRFEWAIGMDRDPRARMCTSSGWRCCFRWPWSGGAC